jgi:hypothetical protein
MFEKTTFRLKSELLNFEHEYWFLTVHMANWPNFPADDTCFCMVDALFPPGVRKPYPLRVRMKATETARRFTTSAYSNV